MRTTYHTPIVTENKGKTKAIAKTVVWTQEYPNIRMEIEHLGDNPDDAKTKLFNFLSINNTQKLEEIEEDLALNDSITDIKAAIQLQEESIFSNARTLANIAIEPNTR